MTSDGSVTSWFGLLQAGEDDAAQRLWRRYFPLLLKAAREKMQGVPMQTADEEDIALSAFHSFCNAARHERIPGVLNRDELWRTLMLITAGKVVDRKRYLGSQKRRNVMGPVGPRPTVSDLDEVIGQEPDPAVAAQLAEEFDLLLNQLDDVELRQTALAKLEGYTNEEIGARLNCSARTVRRRITLIRRLWQQGMETSADL